MKFNALGHKLRKIRLARMRVDKAFVNDLLEIRGARRRMPRRVWRLRRRMYYVSQTTI